MAKKQKKVWEQIRLFNGYHFMVVDPAVNHLEDTLGSQVEHATTMVRYAAISPDVVFKRLVEQPRQPGMYEQWNILGVNVMVTPKRLDSFRHNSTCVSCGRAGNVFLIERHQNDSRGQYINMYSTEKGGLVLMTVDHILPDCMGGRYHPDNFQTMCQKCNSSKGNVMSMKEIIDVRYNMKRYAKSWVNQEFLNLLLDIQVNLNLLKRGPELTKWNIVYDKYRKKIRYETSKEKGLEIIVALRREMLDIVATKTEVTVCPQFVTTVSPATPPVSTVASWNARVRRTFAMYALAAVRAHGAAMSSLAENRVTA